MGRWRGANDVNMKEPRQRENIEKDSSEVIGSR